MIDRTGQISISLYQLAKWSPMLDKAICTTVHQAKKIVYRALVTNIPDIQNFGINCAPLVADLFLFCYERGFMLSLSDNNQTDIIEAFNSTSRYLDDLLNIDTPYFEQIVGQIYPTELQLNKAHSSDTETPFLDLNLSITNDIASKIYDKQDDFNFEIVNFPFLDGDVPMAYIFLSYSFC